jgi:hypothetical protein
MQLLPVEGLSIDMLCDITSLISFVAFFSDAAARNKKNV